jgi:hypothetical protein
MMSDEFKLVKSTRDMPIVGDSGPSFPVTTDTKLMDTIADNFPRIMDVVKDIVDIERMKVQSKAVLEKMAEDRKIILAEAEAYVSKKNADTKHIVDRMRVIQDLLRDFYIYNQKNSSGLSGDDFARIITAVIKDGVDDGYC